MINSNIGSRFFKNIFIIMSGTALAQAVSFALMPVISRLYTPANFGLFGAFTSLVTVISAGATLQYSQALIIPKRKSDAVNIFLLSLLSVVFVSVLCGIAVVLFPQVLCSLVGAPSLSWLLWVLPLSVMFNSVNQVLLAWSVRQKAFRRTAVSPVVRSLTSCSMQIALGLEKNGTFGLVLGTLIGDCAANFNYLRQIFSIDRRLIFRTVNWARMQFLAWEYRDFATYATTQSVISAASIGLPVLMLAHFYGTSSAGYYALGLRVFQVPMALVLTALKQVLFQKANEVNNLGYRLYPLFSKVTYGLFAVAILPAIFFFAFAPDLFSWIFGSGWREAGEYARWLIFWMLLSFSNAPCILFGQILRQQRFMFYFEMLVLLVRVLSLLIGGFYLTALNTIILLSVAGAIMNLCLIARMSYFIWKNDLESGKCLAAIA